MAYAAQEDVEKILPEGETVPGEAEDKLATVLEEATDLVIGYLGFEYDGAPEDDGVPGDVPGAVRRVVARVALRTFVDEPNDPGAMSSRDLMGPFSHDINWSREAQDGSVYLSNGEELRLNPFVRGSTTGAGHYPMYDGQPFYMHAGSVGQYRDSGWWPNDC